MAVTEQEQTDRLIFLLILLSPPFSMFPLSIWALQHTRLTPSAGIPSFLYCRVSYSRLISCLAHVLQLVALKNIFFLCIYYFYLISIFYFIFIWICKCINQCFVGSAQNSHLPAPFKIKIQKLYSARYSPHSRKQKVTHFVQSWYFFFVSWQPSSCFAQGIKKR